MRGIPRNRRIARFEPGSIRAGWSGRVRETRRAQVGGHLRAWRARQRQFAVLLVLPCDRVGIVATRRALCREIIGRANVRMCVGDRNVPCPHARPAARDRCADQRRHRAREVVRTIDARTVAACAHRSGPRGEISARVVTGFLPALFRQPASTRWPRRSGSSCHSFNGPFAGCPPPRRSSARVDGPSSAVIRILSSVNSASTLL